VEGGGRRKSLVGGTLREAGGPPRGGGRTRVNRGPLIEQHRGESLASGPLPEKGGQEHTQRGLVGGERDRPEGTLRGVWWEPRNLLSLCAPAAQGLGQPVAVVSRPMTANCPTS
jgi:hypothetical protein